VLSREYEGHNMFNNKKSKKVEAKSASQVIPKQKVYPPTPLLENENPPAPPLKPRTTIKLPASVQPEQRFSFWQEMLIRMMPLSQEVQSGEIVKITLSFEKGCFVMRTE
jgi:hypothetical protein